MVDVRAHLDEASDGARVAHERGLVKGDAAVAVVRVHVRAVLHQLAHHLHLAGLRGPLRA